MKVLYRTYYSVAAVMIILCYRVSALISVNIVPSWDMEGRKLVSAHRYTSEGQYSPISV